MARTKRKSCALCNRRSNGQCERQHEPFRVNVVWHPQFSAQTRVYELNRKFTLVCPLGCDKFWPQDMDHTLVARHVEQHTEIVFQAHSQTKFTAAAVYPTETSYEALFANIGCKTVPTAENGADSTIAIRECSRAPEPLDSTLWGAKANVFAGLYPSNLAYGSLQGPFEDRLHSHFLSQDVDEVGFASTPNIRDAPSPPPVQESLCIMDARDEDFLGPSAALNLMNCNPFKEQCEGEQPLAHTERSPVAETAIDPQASDPLPLLALFRR
ncbi:hypothetical protein K438DRAFT_1753328 [Mycena galopus ATCC 62051]|nr:hypothetical protein K438DRAFT_1753328 [Mycena galopus ATCC 62051]